MAQPVQISCFIISLCQIWAESVVNLFLGTHPQEFSLNKIDLVFIYIALNEQYCTGQHPLSLDPPSGKGKKRGGFQIGLNN